MNANTAPAVVKTYKYNVAKMIAGSKSKNTGKPWVIEEIADGEFIVKEYVAIKPAAPAKAKKAKVKKEERMVTAMLKVVGNPIANKWWIGAKDNVGKTVWFLKKYCEVFGEDVLVKYPYSKAKTRTNVSWAPVASAA